MDRQPTSTSKLETSKAAIWNLIKQSQVITSDDEHFSDFQESRGELLKKMLLEQNMN